MLKRFAGLFQTRPTSKLELKGVTVRVDDSPGWGELSKRPHDYSSAETQKIYTDALEAWRKNPIAWRIIGITTDYVIGDKIIISSTHRRLDKFINAFWNHPKNRMDLRLEPLCDELSRSGDLFIVLFRNTADGMSYLRLITKDRIKKIDVADNDWETELAYHELLESGQTRVWYSPNHPAAEDADAVVLHYAVNRPAGALLGESDLTTMLPWLQRYSRMLEDRVRLHWAMRAFLWMVTVPSEKVAAKTEQYRMPPDSGSIIVKDREEDWSAVSPDLKGADASHDMRAVRGMIDAGSGYPPHWRGEAADSNLATATAMQAPTERHLMRRQDYFVFIIEDILVQAYRRAVLLGTERPLPMDEYSRLFTISVPDVSRNDNEMLARAAKDLAATYQTLETQMPGRSKQLSRLMTQLVLRFAGQPQDDHVLDQIIQEAWSEETPKQ
jgi:hypothetical protein